MFFKTTKIAPTSVGAIFVKLFATIHITRAFDFAPYIF